MRKEGLLSVRPGITDLASIVFADENDILADSTDPDLDYNQLIRPWKSRLGLAYVENANIALDMKIIWLTAAGLVSRRLALEGVASTLASMGCDARLVSVARRVEPTRRVPAAGGAGHRSVSMTDIETSTRAQCPTLSIVIPCLNEETYPAHLPGQLAPERLSPY